LAKLYKCEAVKHVKQATANNYKKSTLTRVQRPDM